MESVNFVCIYFMGYNFLCNRCDICNSVWSKLQCMEHPRRHSPQLDVVYGIGHFSSS